MQARSQHLRHPVKGTYFKYREHWPTLTHVDIVTLLQYSEAISKYAEVRRTVELNAASGLVISGKIQKRRRESNHFGTVRMSVHFQHSNSSRAV